MCSNFSNLCTISQMQEEFSTMSETFTSLVYDYLGFLADKYADWKDDCLILFHKDIFQENYEK